MRKDESDSGCQNAVNDKTLTEKCKRRGRRIIIEGVVSRY